MGTVVSLASRRRARAAAAAASSALGRPPRATFMFDLADPGTYLAAERIDGMLAAVDWVPVSRFALAGDIRGRTEHEVAARAAALRMPLNWPVRGDEPRPAAMRAAAYAAEQGRGAAFVLAASRLAFCGGFDLDDPEVLAEAAAAASLGLDECLHAAGDAARDLAIEDAACALARDGCTRLPAVRVGAMLFCGEERVIEAIHAARGPHAFGAGSGA